MVPTRLFRLEPSVDWEASRTRHPARAGVIWGGHESATSRIGMTQTRPVETLAARLKGFQPEQVHVSGDFKPRDAQRGL